MKIWKDTKIEGNLDVEGEVRIDVGGGYLVNIKDLFKPKVYAARSVTGAGWYRIGKVSGTYSGFVHVHQNYNNNIPTMTTLLFQIIYMNGKIKNLSTVTTKTGIDSGNEATSGISGARITREGGTDYINSVYYLEVYYNRSPKSNSLYANIDSYIGHDGAGIVRNAIEPLNFEPTNPDAEVLTEITIANT